MKSVGQVGNTTSHNAFANEADIQTIHSFIRDQVCWVYPLSRMIITNIALDMMQECFGCQVCMPTVNCNYHIITESTLSSIVNKPHALHAHRTPEQNLKVLKSKSSKLIAKAST